MKHGKQKLFVATLMALAFAGAQAAPPTVDDVGDVQSFGHNAQYMGAKSGFIQLSPDPCPVPSPTPDPGNQCFQIVAPPPATTTFVAEDILFIKLPKKATRTIIYPALNFFLNYQLQNTTGVAQPQGLFAFLASLDIESDVLLDPTIIDPGTGLPANGKLTNQFTYRYRDDRSMDVTDRQRTQITLVRVGNAGINKSQLVGMGLSQAVVDNLFNGEMTIRMRITGSATLLTDATLTANMRLFGD